MRFFQKEREGNCKMATREFTEQEQNAANAYRLLCYTIFEQTLQSEGIKLTPEQTEGCLLAQFPTFSLQKQKCLLLGREVIREGYITNVMTPSLLEEIQERGIESEIRIYRGHCRLDLAARSLSDLRRTAELKGIDIEGKPCFWWRDDLIRVLCDHDVKKFLAEYETTLRALQEEGEE
jgi:hypothetical protein